MTTTPNLDVDRLISERARGIDVSGIRKMFELAAGLENPINLSIGQPDFPVPDAIKEAAIDAVRRDQNGYTVTTGLPDLLERIARHLEGNVGWRVPSDDLGLMVTSGTSGAIYLACLALLDAGDEAVIPDPYFVIYPHIVRTMGATPVMCDTYPDGRMTAERIEPLLTERTKLVLVNSPGNPTGAVLTSSELRDIVDLCDSRNVLLLSDEIYDEFTYADAREDGLCPSPARLSDRVLLIRGFGKTYGCTGWRLGYAAGPTPLIQNMAKMQQYTYVCAPSIGQAGVLVAFDVDMSPQVRAYEKKRDMVLDALGEFAEVVRPGGAFYAFVQVPEHLGAGGTEFSKMAVGRNLIVVPGGVFSERDTHFRISYAAADTTLERGLDVLRDLLKE